jgi:cytoskeletal protein CcmA (bactofilin family)
MKKLLKYKVFSGALQFTIFIGVLIAILLAGLMMLQNSHYFFIQQSKATPENLQLLNSGINYLLKQDKPILDTLELEGLSNPNQKVAVQLSQWGVYEKAIVKTSFRKSVFYKSALLGSKIENTKRANLYLQDSFKPLTLVGNTILKGNLSIPNQGINAGYIANESFYGQQLFQGKTNKSSIILPKLKKNYKETIAQFLTNNNFNENNYIATQDLPKYTNSFLKPTKIYYSKSIIELNNNQLSGNIIIKSDEAIRVQKGSLLENIILIAPIVTVENQVVGNFQIIASKNISIGKNCKLNYPSALVLLQEQENNANPNTAVLESQITVDENTEIRGTICYFKSIKENDFKTQLILNKTAILKGEVYCQGNFELKGKVVGSVYTEQFIANAVGSVFINYLYNAQIVNDNFPENYCGILFENNTKGVAQWIY